jgi:1,4-dihydroxy-2-naphthoate octaprenyltransferase
MTLACGRPGGTGNPEQMKACELRSSVAEGFWRLADPKISITSLACMVVGGSVAAAEGPIRWIWLVATGLALFCMEVAKNAWGDVFDYDSGTDLAVAPVDRTNFSGGKRVLVDRLLTRGQTWAIAVGFGLAGLLLGAAIVFWCAPAAFWIGIVGLALGWSYHGPPLRLAYRGLGELDVVLCYGPLIAVSTYVIQTNTWSWDVFWLSLPLGLFIAAFLWVNEFPDYTADKSVGKNNLVVLLGRRRASRVLPLIYLSGFVLLAVLPLSGLPGLPTAVLLGLLALPTAAYACGRAWVQPETFYRHHPVQPAALLTFVLYSIGVGAGVLIGQGPGPGQGW